MLWNRFHIPEDLHPAFHRRQDPGQAADGHRVPRAGTAPSPGDQPHDHGGTASSRIAA